MKRRLRPFLVEWGLRPPFQSGWFLDSDHVTEHAGRLVGAKRARAFPKYQVRLRVGEAIVCTWPEYGEDPHAAVVRRVVRTPVELLLVTLLRRAFVVRACQSFVDAATAIERVYPESIVSINWEGFALPKTGETPKTRRATRRRKVLAEAAVDRDDLVMQRYGGRCVAHGISPQCTREATDPHELIPVSRGGPRESWNRVPMCRRCHREAQGRVGGNRLVFDWPGKDDGSVPVADVSGTVRVTWRPTGASIFR